MMWKVLVKYLTTARYACIRWWNWCGLTPERKLPSCHLLTTSQGVPGFSWTAFGLLEVHAPSRYENYFHTPGKWFLSVNTQAWLLSEPLKKYHDSLLNVHMLSITLHYGASAFALFSPHVQGIVFLLIPFWYQSRQILVKLSDLGDLFSTPF